MTHLVQSNSLLDFEIYTSDLWQLNSILLRRNASCLLVDPGYFPRELEAIVQRTHSFDVHALVFTHGHFDHVIGSTLFPKTPVWVSPALAQAVQQNTDEAARNQQAVDDFDGRYYVRRAHPFAWPQRMVPITPDTPLHLEDVSIQALLLPGHSADGLGLYIPAAHTLIVGDYLSSCEIPFVEDAEAYFHTLTQLILLMPKITQVIPGHGPLLTADQARSIAEQDLRYVEALLTCRQKQDIASAHNIPLPRAAHVPGMIDEHAKNCRNLGIHNDK